MECIWSCIDLCHWCCCSLPQLTSSRSLFFQHTNANIYSHLFIFEHLLLYLQQHYCVCLPRERCDEVKRNRRRILPDMLCLFPGSFRTVKHISIDCNCWMLLLLLSSILIYLLKHTPASTLARSSFFIHSLFLFFHSIHCFVRVMLEWETYATFFHAAMVGRWQWCCCVFKVTYKIIDSDVGNEQK